VGPTEKLLSERESEVENPVERTERKLLFVLWVVLFWFGFFFLFLVFVFFCVCFFLCGCVGFFCFFVFCVFFCFWGGVGVFCFCFGFLLLVVGVGLLWGGGFVGVFVFLGVLVCFFVFFFFCGFWVVFLGLFFFWFFKEVRLTRVPFSWDSIQSASSSSKAKEELDGPETKKTERSIIGGKKLEKRGERPDLLRKTLGEKTKHNFVVVAGGGRG